MSATANSLEVKEGEALVTELVEDTEHFESLACEWKRLWASSPNSEVFQSFPWAHAWWSAFGNNLRLCTIVVYRRGQVVGILPLVLKNRTVQFIGDPGSDYNDILCEERDATEVLKAAFQRLIQVPGWNVCKLANVPEHSRIVQSLPSLPLKVRRKLGLLPVLVRSCISLEPDRGEILRQARRKPVLRRHVNKLYKSGTVAFRHIESRSDAHRHLENLFKQHIERRAMAGDCSQFLRPEYRALYHSLVDEMDPRRDLRFCVLEFAGQPIAYHFGFEAHGKYLMYKTAFDIDFWEYSPGDVLLSNLLSYAEHRDIMEFDFTIGSEDYKEHFANDVSWVYLMFVSRGPIRLWLRLLEGRTQILSYKLAASPLFKKLMSGLNEVRALMLFRSGCETPSTSGKFRRAQTLDDAQNLLDPTGAAADSDRLFVAQLSDIARLALKFPELLDRERLHNYRKRLRRGDVCYLVQHADSAELAWVGRRDLPRDNDPAITFPAMVLYEFCSFPSRRRSAMHPKLLCALIREARTQGMEAYVYCPRENR